MAKDDHIEEDNKVEADSNNVNVKRLREEKASLFSKALALPISSCLEELLAIEKKARLVSWSYTCLTPSCVLTYSLA